VRGIRSGEDTLAVGEGEILKDVDALKSACCVQKKVVRIRGERVTGKLSDP